MSMHSETDHGPRFTGRFSDGKSAVARDVDVRLGERGIIIVLPGVSEPLVWPYGALHPAEPLTDHSIDALITYDYMPGATLFVPDDTFARKLAARAPHMTARATRWRHARPWIWATAATVLLSVLLWVAELSPSQAIARRLPDGVRTKLGEQVVASMTDGHKVCTDEKGNAALDKLVKRLSDAAGHDKPFKVVVVDWGLLNAFATPGEQIVLTRGLIDKADSADEVAGVLGHEMGHGIEMHPETSVVRAIGLSAAVELMVGGGGGTMSNIGIMLAQITYTRDAERQADDHAISILRKAQISPSGFADFFKRISPLEGRPKEGRTARALDILSTHPPSEERRRLIERQPDYPATPALTNAEWQALRAICGAPSDKSKDKDDADDGVTDL